MRFSVTILTYIRISIVVTTMKLKQLISLIAIVFLLSNCRKIAITLDPPFTVPDSSMADIFSDWYFVSSSGGFIGGGSDHYKIGDHISFSKDGIFTEHLGSNSNSQKYWLKLYDPGWNGSNFFVKYNQSLTQSFRISHDTLYLSDFAFDAFDFVFKK